MVSEHASPLAALGGVDAGGQNVHVAALARTLAHQGAEVTVHTRRDDPGLDEEVRLAPGVTVHHVDAGPPRAISKDDLLPYMDAFADVLADRWRRRRPDVVHAHFWMSAIASLKAARLLGLPVVQTFHALGVVKRRHQGDRDTSPPARLELERGIIEDVDAIVCSCTDEAFELIRLGANRSQLNVIPSGVDLELFTPDGPRERVPPGVRRLVTVGRLVQRKGVGNVISALPALPEAELVVVGGPDACHLGEDREARRLSSLAAELGVSDRVELRGRLAHEEVPPLMRSTHALVSVPWYEPFGIAPVEAMACGVPVVASAVGGLVDTVVDSETGVHVPPRDPERLAEALRALLDDDQRRAAYGQAGVRRARALYHWGRIGAATHDVYRRLAHPRAARRRGAAEPRPAARDLHRHVGSLGRTLSLLEAEIDRLDRWGCELARRLGSGARLLVVGNGGSAAEAQHLTGELVGRFSADRAPLSAICLHADTSSLTAIANDFGAEAAFARQVHAHGRRGDILLALSTSGRSLNVVAAVEAARELGMTAWTLTGPGSCPLADLCDDAVCLPVESTATVQELHLVAIHLLCVALDRELVAVPRRPRASMRRSRYHSNLQGIPS